MTPKMLKLNEARFLAKIDTSGGEDACHPWTGCLVVGYGWTTIGKKGMGSHRRIWEIHHGPITGGLYVLHQCDNRPCCNIRHLFLGTQKDNDTDKRQKGREWRGRLTIEEVQEIRRAYDQGGSVGASVFARRHRLTTQMIWQIGTRKTYRWVEEETSAL